MCKYVCVLVRDCFASSACLFLSCVCERVFVWVCLFACSCLPSFVTVSIKFLCLIMCVSVCVFVCLFVCVRVYLQGACELVFQCLFVIFSGVLLSANFCYCIGVSFVFLWVRISVCFCLCISLFVCVCVRISFLLVRLYFVCFFWMLMCVFVCQFLLLYLSFFF